MIWDDSIVFVLVYTIGYYLLVNPIYIISTVDLLIQNSFSVCLSKKYKRFVQT